MRVGPVEISGVWNEDWNSGARARPYSNGIARLEFCLSLWRNTIGATMLLYYITDRKSLAGTDAQQRSRLLARIGKAAHAGVDYIQLREKDLAARDLERLARDAVQVVRANFATAKLLVNGRADVALASGADGVHLPAGEMVASEVRALWMQAGDRAPVIAVSAHTIEEGRADTAGDCGVGPHHRRGACRRRSGRKLRGVSADFREGEYRCTAGRNRRAARRVCVKAPRRICGIGHGRSHSRERRGMPRSGRRRNRGDSLVSERRYRRDDSAPARAGRVERP